MPPDIENPRSPTEKLERQLEAIQAQNRQIIDYLRILAYYATKKAKEGKND
jgi:hypothetical protein